MKWEFLGRQEMPESEKGKRGYTYLSLLWRSPVPGGWLLMTLNAKSSDPSPTTSFYPDPEHLWTGGTNPGADYLLRPASGGAISAPDHLLRPALEPAPEIWQEEE